MPLMILSTQKYKMGTGKLSGKPDEMRGGNLAMELASHPERRGGGGMPLMILSTQKYKTGTRVLVKCQGSLTKCGVVTGISSSWMGKDSLLW